MSKTDKTKTTLGAGLAASLLAVLGLAAWATATATAAPSKLVGTVGPGYTISLKNAAGKKVTTVTRGSYKITVRDRSEDHNFYLSGPGVRKQITGVDFVGTKTVTVRLAPGKYGFVCTPHSDEMHGGFSVR